MGPAAAVLFSNLPEEKTAEASLATSLHCDIHDPPGCDAPVTFIYADLTCVV